MVVFNPQQTKAIEHYKDPCAVIAAAGSGKSTVLVNRVKNLVENHDVDEDSILAITFTRNTANDLKRKLYKMDIRGVNTGTFHSICNQILKQEEVGIEFERQIKEWQIENCLKRIDKKVNIDDVMNFISYQKNYLKLPSDNFVEKESMYDEDQLRIFYKEYESFKSKNELYDFDDYLLNAYEILKSNPNKYDYKFVLVDEHQDTNLVQNLILKEVCQSGNIFCLFDYRQSIYEFRGGNPEYAMNFDKEWDNAKVINLDINYRSTKNIVNKANGFIRKYYGDYTHYSDSISDDKSDGDIKVESHTDKDEESIEVVDRIEELIDDGHKPDSVAVLYRLNSNVDYIENQLKRRKIDYDITNSSSFFKRREIDGILSYLRLIMDENDNNAFDKILKFRSYPITYFKNTIFDNIRDYANVNDESLFYSASKIKYPQKWQERNMEILKDDILSLQNKYKNGVSVTSLINQVVKYFKIEELIKDNYLTQEEIDERLKSIDTLKTFVKNNTLESFLSYVYLSNNKQKNKKDCVKLMTIHSSKGLEWNNVFVVGVEDDKFPHEKSNILEEARLFYVAVTRAKENLHISEIGKGNQFIREYGVKH